MVGYALDSGIPGVISVRAVTVFFTVGFIVLASISN